MATGVQPNVRVDRSAGLEIAFDLVVPYRSWLASNRAALVEALGTLVIARIALEIVALMAKGFLPQQSGLFSGTFHASPYAALDVWARWDSAFYLDIAQHGYGAHSYLGASFPLYPTLMIAVAPFVGHDYVLSGVVVSILATYVALVYTFKLVAWEFGEAAARRAVLYVVVYPTAVFLFAVYTESVYLAMTVATFYYARRGQWLTAALFAFLTGLSRVTATILFLPLAYEAFGQLRWRIVAGESWPRLVIRPFLAVAAAPAGLLVFAGYVAVVNHDLFAYIDVQGHWPFNRHPSWPWLTLLGSVHDVSNGIHDPALFYWSANVQDLVTATILIVACIVSWRCLPRLYAIYLTAAFLFMLTSTVPGFALQSLPRYSLTMFPLFMLLARLGANRFGHQAILLTCAPLLGLYTALFAQWYWVF